MAKKGFHMTEITKNKFSQELNSGDMTFNYLCDLGVHVRGLEISWLFQGCLEGPLS